MEHETHGQLVFVPELLVGIDENLSKVHSCTHAIQPNRHRHHHHRRDVEGNPKPRPSHISQLVHDDDDHRCRVVDDVCQLSLLFVVRNHCEWQEATLR